MLYCKFTTKQKLQLIQAKRSNGYPGLYMALQLDNRKTVDEYIKLILIYDQFTAEQKMELLQAKVSNGFLGLHQILNNDHANIFEIYILSIINAKELDIKQKIELCYIFRSKEKYKNIIINSYLPAEEKKQLLMLDNSCTIM